MQSNVKQHPKTALLCAATTLTLGLSLNPAWAKEYYSSDSASTQTQLDQFSTKTDTTRSLDGPVFGTEPLRTYPFPAKGRDLDPGVYWQVTGHSSGHKRDMNATRFNAATGKWTANRANSAGLSDDEKRLIWNTPVYAPASGIVLTCWRNAPDGYDPGEAGCGDNADKNSLCRTPAGGNHVRIWIPEERRMILLAHFRQGTVPDHLCPHDESHVADWEDKSGAFGFNPDILVPFPFITVNEGDYIGRVGNSGRSGGPHLHVQLEDCESPPHVDTCHVRSMPFDGADVAQKPVGRDVYEEEWLALNGALSVTSPRQLVRPDRGVGGFIPVPHNTVSLAQQADGYAQVILGVTNPEDPVDAYQWEKIAPSTKQLEDQLTLGWQIDATCASGVKSIQLNSPGGVQSQTYPAGQTVVSGSFETQSFSSEEVATVCLDWAEQQSSDTTCSQNPEVCDHTEAFHLVGGESAGTAESTVQILVQCQNGDSAATSAQPHLTLECGATPFGYLY